MQNNILLLPLPFFNQPRGLQKKTYNPVLGQEERLSLLEKPKVSRAPDPLGTAGSRNPRPPGTTLGHKNLSFRVSTSKTPATAVEYKRNSSCISSVRVFVYISKILPHF